MSYWQIVLGILATLGGGAVLAVYIGAMVTAFEDDYRLVGWLMAAFLFAAFIFGLPWLIMVTS